MGKLHDKTVKKLIKNKPSVRRTEGNGLYLITPKRGVACWMLSYPPQATKLRRDTPLARRATGRWPTPVTRPLDCGWSSGSAGSFWQRFTSKQTWSKPGTAIGAAAL